MPTIADLGLSDQGKDFVKAMIRQGKIPDADLEAMSNDVTQVSEETKVLLRNAVRGQFATNPAGFDPNTVVGNLRSKVATSEAMGKVAGAIGQHPADVTNVVTDPGTIGSVAAQFIPVAGQASLAAKGAQALSKVPGVRAVAQTAAETAVATAKGFVGNVAGRQATYDETLAQSAKTAAGEELLGTATGAALSPGVHAFNKMKGGDLLSSPEALQEVMFNSVSKKFAKEKDTGFLDAARRTGLEPGKDFTLGMATRDDATGLKNLEGYATIAQRTLTSRPTVLEVAASAKKRLQRTLETQVVRQNPSRKPVANKLSTGEEVMHFTAPDAKEVGDAVEHAAVVGTLMNIQNKGLELPPNVIELIGQRKYGEAMTALDKGFVNKAYDEARATAAPLKVSRDWAMNHPDLLNLRASNIGGAPGQPYGAGRLDEGVKAVDRVVNDYILKSPEVAKRLGATDNPQFKNKAITVKDLFDAKKELANVEGLSGSAGAYQQRAIAAIDSMLDELGATSSKEYGSAVAKIRQAEANRREYGEIIRNLEDIVKYDTKGISQTARELFAFDGTGSFRGIDVDKWKKFERLYGGSNVGQQAIQITRQHVADQIAAEISGRTGPDIAAGNFSAAKSAEAVNKVIQKYGERGIKEVLGPDFLQFVRDYQTVVSSMSASLKAAGQDTAQAVSLEQSPLQSMRKVPLVGLAMLTYFAPKGTAMVAAPVVGTGAMLSKLYFSGLPKAVITGEYVIKQDALRSKAVMTRLAEALGNRDELTQQDKEFIMSIMEENDATDSEGVGAIGVTQNPGATTVVGPSGNPKGDFLQYLDAIPAGGRQGAPGKTQSPVGIAPGKQGASNAFNSTGAVSDAGGNRLPGDARGTGVVSNSAAEVSRTLVAGEEGLHTKVYKDGNGFRTVGLGFNMDAKGARASWDAAGIPESFTKVLAGQQELSLASARKLLDDKHAEAEGFARAVVKSYDKLQPNQQAALTSLAFQLGKAGLAGFKNTLAALERGDMKAVYNGLVNSKMGRQDSPIRTKIQALMITQNMTPEQAEAHLLKTKQITEKQLRHTVKDPRITALLTGNQVA